MSSVAELARLSAYVYPLYGSPNMSARLGPSQLDIRGFTSIGTASSVTGFFAEAFIRGSEVVISYRGTEIPEVNDLIADAQQVGRVEQ